MLRMLIIIALLAFPVLSWATSIHIEWGYTPPVDPAVSGFKLYQEGVYACQTTNANARDMDCNVTITKPTTDYTLTAAFIDGTESPHSSPFAFTPTVPTGVPAPQIFKIVESGQ